MRNVALREPCGQRQIAGAIGDTAGVGDDVKPTVVERRGSKPPERGAARAPADEPSADDGTRRYEAVAEIGRGGMGRVVEARDTVLDRVVAVKQVLTDDRELRRRFARETRITARLEHPSIVPVYDAHTDGDAPFYVMRRVTGRPLAELIDDAPSQARRLALLPHLLAAAQATAHAHKRGVIHRDLKPTNILVGELGETVVIDWGLAKVVGEPDDDDEPAIDAGSSLRTRVGVVCGTPGFMPPEQLDGNAAGPQSDVYALGACLYHLLAGKPPHHAADGDEMMRLAMLGPPAPIATLAPGLPPELSTIVDTALAYDPRRRYRDAGALAADLERFLAGQLVASHRYSRRERLARFVRKHRAAVAIGAGALLVLVAIGGIAIASVVRERDRADAQARRAEAKQLEAEAARASADERAAQLLLLRARGLADTDPTAAIAALKQLPRTSARIDEARAIASSAALRGVAWGIELDDELTVQAVLDATATRLIRVTQAGRVEVWDVARYQRLFERRFAPGTRAAWANDRVLLYAQAAPALLEPATQQLTPLDMPAVEEVAVDVGGTRAIARTAAGEAVAIDLVANRATRPWPGHVVQGIEIAPDASWYALADATQLVVFEAGGTARYRHAGEALTMAASVDGRLALIDGLTVIDVTIATGAERRITGFSASRQPLALQYRDRELLVLTAMGEILSPGPGELFERLGAGHVTWTLGPLGPRHAVMMRDQTHVAVVEPVGTRTVALPVAVTRPRLAASTGAPRFVVVGDRTMVVIDMTPALPVPVEAPRFRLHTFVSDDWMLEQQGDLLEAWLHLPTGRRTEIQRGASMIELLDSDATHVLLRERRGERAQALWLLAFGQVDPRPVAHGQQLIGRMLPGGAIVLADGGKLAVQRGDQDPRVLEALDEPVVAIEVLGPDRFLAVTATELVRGDAATGRLERLATAPRTDALAIARDPAGRPLACRGKRLLRWERDLVELTSFGSDCWAMRTVRGGAVVTLADNSVVFVDLRTGVSLHHLRQNREDVMLDHDGTRLVFRGNRGFDIIELPSRARWELPIPGTLRDVRLSTGGRHASVPGTDGRTHIWTLPRADEEVAALLARLTNATESADGAVRWPWQDSASR